MQSNSSPAKAAAMPAWSVRSPRMRRTPPGTSASVRPRLKIVTSWPCRASSRTRASPLKRVPPMTSTFIATLLPMRCARAAAGRGARYHGRRAERITAPLAPDARILRRRAPPRRSGGRREDVPGAEPPGRRRPAPAFRTRLQGCLRLGAALAARGV